MNPVILTFNNRVKERPYVITWENSEGGFKDGISGKGEFNFDGLEDKYKMLLYVYSWNLSETCPFKRTIRKFFSWTDYKIQKIYKELKTEELIDCVCTFSEDTGLLSGRGYEINWKVYQQIIDHKNKV